MNLEAHSNCRFMDGQNIVIDCAEQEVGVNLELNKTCRNSAGILCGRVLNKLGEPIPHALVKVVTETYDPIFHTKTDGEGNYFIFDIPANHVCKLIAIAEGYQLSEESKVCLAEQEILSINLLLSHNASEAGVITGVVLNKINALPVNKARVVLFEPRNGEELVKDIGTTNEMGQFALTKLALGSYRVKVCATGYIGEQYNVELTDSTQISNHLLTLSPDMTRSKGMVFGVITDQNKKPVPEADVILYRVGQNGGITPIAYAKANRDGVYLFMNVETGAYKVIAK